MTEQHFTNLHLHTDFSLLDGAISLDRLVEFGKQNQWKALAITDHGNIFGAVKFFQKCKKAGIRPVLGMEAYLTEDVSIKNVENKYYHLTLLVENETGYKNLCKLIAFSYQQGFYFRPRIDYQILERHASGLIALSGCLGGHISQLILKNDLDQARERIAWLSRVFGPERFYLEVQPDDQDDQKKVNQQLFMLSAETHVPLVATADSHYPTEEDREAHEVMLCIQTHHKLTDTDRYTFGDCRVHIRTTTQMLELFNDHPEAVWNAGRIADRCNFDFQTGKLFFPKFEIPAEHTQETFFTQLAQQGFHDLVAKQMIPSEQIELYQARLTEELDLIIKMGFVGYFLVVSDFIQWAKKNDIPVGPGRGSAAGSLASWALQITNIDPIKYNLVFERFLNPERVTMPDIDIDFCINGRDRVINYVRDTYGHSKVCQIITFGTLMAKGVIKDVARVLGLPFEDSNNLTTLIGDQLKITLKEAVEQEPRLQELIHSNPKIAKIFDLAYRLEGLTRHASKHAAGIVISPEPVDEVLPLYVPPKSTDLVTQYAMTELETLGFLKIDFLGLQNLTLIDHTLKLIKKLHGISLNIDTLDLTDTKTFSLLSEGKTSGVFQLESSGIKEVLRRLQPTTFEDIIAVNALYRPGPLGSGMVDDFVERRHGRQKIEYLFPELEPILKDTYGVIVYQEQVMKAASAIAGFSLGQADILRRAMGKKKAEVMAEQRAIFIEGAKKGNFNEDKAGQLFDLMAYFAGYGFNKSHSAAYAMIAYQTAYLKAHYPAEFMACLLSLESTNADNLSFYLEEAKSMGLTIIPPDINRSDIQFSVIEGALLFGLEGIKNVGKAALEGIIKEREQRPFVDLLDFCTRVDLRTVNTRVIENFICAGTFDQLPGNRAQQTTQLSPIIERALEIKKSKETGQMDLFGLARSSLDTTTPELYQFAPCAPWSDKEKLDKEKEVVGFYLSAHPLDMYREILKQLHLSSFETLTKQTAHSTALPGGPEPVVAGCGLLKHKKIITTKKGETMAFIALEDKHGTAEIVIFPKLFKKVEELLTTHHVFLVKGTLDLMASKQCKIRAQEFVPLENVFEHWSSFDEVMIQLPQTVTETALTQLKKNMRTGTSLCTLMYCENGKQLALRLKHKIVLTAELRAAISHEQMHLKIKV